MKLNIVTIALDAMPWIGAQFAELCRAQDIDWHWSIVEGASMPEKDTAWMGAQEPRLSHDGTTQFLQGLSLHPRITVKSKPSWGGKLEQINAGIAAFKSDGVLLQMDSDELWTSFQLFELLEIFSQNQNVSTVQVAMDYMLGPNVVSASVNGYGNRKSEWIRAWRYRKGLWMECHEPPRFNGNRDVMGKEESEDKFGRILHMAWVSPQQVAQKQRIYRGGYENAMGDWLALQNNQDWPVRDLSAVLPWVGKGASAEILFDR